MAARAITSPSGLGVLPDIITMGKAISSGYAPLSATLAADKVVERFARSVSGEFTHGSTHSGSASPASSAFRSMTI